MPRWRARLTPCAKRRSWKRTWTSWRSRWSMWSGTTRTRSTAWRSSSSRMPICSARSRTSSGRGPRSGSSWWRPRDTPTSWWPSCMSCRWVGITFVFWFYISFSGLIYLFGSNLSFSFLIFFLAHYFNNWDLIIEEIIETLTIPL